MSISTASVNTSAIKRYRFVATGGETSISGVDANGNTLSYTPNVEQVYINGVLQVRGQDYTGTTGTSITSLAALTSNDSVEIVTFEAFTVATALGAAQSSAPTNPVEGQIWLNTAGTMADGGNIAISTIDAKGDLLAGTADNTIARLAVGTNGQYLKADSTAATGLSWATLPSSGKVLQVVQGTTTTVTALSSTTYTDTTLSASITPSATSSKVAVIVMLSTGITSVVDGNGHGMWLKLVRGSTDVFENTRALIVTSPSGGMYIQNITPMSYLDSPSTTSSTTYKVQFRCDAASTTCYTQIAAMPSSILLLEIGA